MPLCSTNYSDFADFPQHFFSEPLWLQQWTWFGTARVNKHFRNQNAALFQRICHCPWNHNVSSRANRLCLIRALFYFPNSAAAWWDGWGWALRRGSEPSLGCVLTPPHLQVISSSKAQRGQCSCQSNAPPSESSVPYLPINNRKNPTGGQKNPTNLLKERWSVSSCSSPLHGNNGLKMTYTPSTCVWHLGTIVRTKKSVLGVFPLMACPVTHSSHSPCGSSLLSSPILRTTLK